MELAVCIDGHAGERDPAAALIPSETAQNTRRSIRHTALCRIEVNPAGIGAPRIAGDT